MNPFYNPINDLQNLRNQVDRQIQQYQNYQPPQVTQNFQIAPTNNVIRLSVIYTRDRVKSIPYFLCLKGDKI